jgi:hypothetical protein
MTIHAVPFKSMSSKICKGIVRFSAIALYASPLAAFAQSGTAPEGQGFVDRMKQGTEAAGTPAGLTNVPPLETVIGRVIGAILGFLGVILLGYILYAGFLWMTAGGDKTKIQTATAMIRNAIIGLIIIASAYAITSFVLGRLVPTGSTSGISD